ncbi:MAG: phenylalanine--tRNA ligase subunit alpha [Candidatus Micrarchaeota archaeon]|nr:phenylalanine--tRNA ligase subunit alpha [Candidatus Micrarchaeota archaeon]
MSLHQVESKILSVLSGKMTSEEIAQKAGLPHSSVVSFAESLRQKGLVLVSHEKRKGTIITEEGLRFLSEGFPEEKVAQKAMPTCPLSSLSQEERSVGIPWALKNGWVKVEAGEVRAICRPEGYGLRLALQKALANEEIEPQAEEILAKRKLLRHSAATTIFIEPASAQLPTESESGQTNILTRQMLLSGAWREARLRKYDISAPVEIPFVAKRHAIMRMREKIAEIFSEMGFEEMEGEEVQSSFWNFDALFQPQDHPARDLADTFYLKGTACLPADAALVERVKRVHEKWWGGKWMPENASRPVLRTHTTAVSAFYLYNFCQGRAPKKYFSIGKVYRNEATDYKHLAEFFQVEGIVVWEGATFRHLLGCLKEFYRKLGFPKIRFEPSYFPYTEPSLQVMAYFEKKRQWIELGGAGIFRPEVSITLCDRYPVLAWGLSLERPIMLLSEAEDIRDFYKSNIGWLRKQKIASLPNRA